MIVYTCQTPGYDELRTDGIIVIPPSDIFRDDRLNAKLPKILPHLFFRSEITVWCDANVFLSEANLQEIEKKLQSADVVALSHPERNCIYSEAQVCIDAGLDDAEKIREQMKCYRKNEWPENAGLYGCGVLARRVGLVNLACERWWAQITRWSSRDQLSFPPCFSSLDLAIETIPFESVEIRKHL